eukprot:TRINITY_DN4236_c0_g2_i1.p2 TRINITY_DN4236_c0_g2~~TRINITY_DN4236_c0_g2_i1.p2  ORF type:complete len:244 (-),score=62.20 TRINITY_DN4236_c0_g2_i1:1200-1931(-)
MRTVTNALKLRHSIEKHCAGNPFIENMPLKHLASSALVPESAKDDMLHFAKKGQKRFEDFVQDRLLTTSPSSVWDSMKKLKLKMFSNLKEKTKVSLGQKVVKLREERQLLGRFLIILENRPGIVPKLEDTIGDFEMSVVPRSICAVDGSLYIPADKASLMHGIEEIKPQSDEQMPLDMTPDIPQVLIVDAMAVLQSITKTSSMKKLSDLQNAFIKRIKSMMLGYSEGRVIFDRYVDDSLKNKT